MSFFSSLINSDTVKGIADGYFQQQGIPVRLSTPAGTTSREASAQLSNPGAAASGRPAQPLTTNQGVLTDGLPWYRTTIGMIGIAVAGIAIVGAFALAARK